MSEIARKHEIIAQKYTDDEQLLISFNPNTESSKSDALRKPECCVEEITSFLLQNKLCNNGDKIEFLHIGSHQQLKK